MARVAFVMEQTLGHVTHARNLSAMLAERPEIEAEWLPIPFGVGGLARLLPLYRDNWSVRASWRARRALDAALARGPLDGLVFHTQCTALFSVDRMRQIPAVISLDATPINYDVVSQYGGYDHRAAGQGFLDRQKYLMNRRAFHAAAALVPWSEWARRSLIDDYGADPDRIRVLAPGAAPSFLELGRRRLEAERPSAPTEPVRVLFVGGDWRRKGGPLLLEALAGLPAGSWQLDVVTREPVPPTAGVTVHHGVGPNSADLLQLFGEADLFVLPSLGECLAVVLMEATAAGLPVITTDVGALGEAVVSGETGLIVPPKDVSALRLALAALLDDPARRVSMGRGGHALARERFDAEANNRALLDLVAESVQPGRRERSTRGSPRAGVVAVCGSVRT
jgi:glycosyltransferase involved in cell wall biosynthesis